MSQISQKALVVAFFLFYVLYAIVLLNLFIGIVTDVYPRAAERSTAQWEASITALMEVRTLLLLEYHKCFTWVLPPGRGSSKAEGPPQPRLRVMVEVASVLPTVPANTTRRGGGCDHCVRVPCSCPLASRRPHRGLLRTVARRMPPARPRPLLHLEVLPRTHP